MMLEGHELEIIVGAIINFFMNLVIVIATLIICHAMINRTVERMMKKVDQAETARKAAIERVACTLREASSLNIDVQKIYDELLGDEK